MSSPCKCRLFADSGTRANPPLCQCGHGPSRHLDGIDHCYGVSVTPRRGQARLPMTDELPLRLNGYDHAWIGVQNIALARIDVQDASDKPRRLALNLYVADIDRLIDALQQTKAALQERSDYLMAYLAEHPEAILPQAEVGA